MGKQYGYFNTDEFESKDGEKSPFEMVVKPEVIYLCNAIRGAFGKPLIVTSGYRSPEHNETVGGVTDSYHSKGLACDLHCANGETKILQHLADRLNPCGGVGYYDWGVHIDCRGTKARWDYRTKK